MNNSNAGALPAEKQEAHELGTGLDGTLRAAHTGSLFAEQVLLDRHSACDMNPSASLLVKRDTFNSAMTMAPGNSYQH